MARPVRALALAFTFILFACGSDPGGPPGQTDTDGDIPPLGTDGGTPSSTCEGTETRCLGMVFQTCNDGEFVDTQTCANACDSGLGCVSCTPGEPVCDGNTVHSCNADGTIGDQVEDCGLATCGGGQCQTDCTAGGVDLIYVVDDDNNFLSFDPAKLGTAEDPFTLVGQLDCDAGRELPGGFGADRGAPFSMSVDRTGIAWVLYSSGEIFHVSIEDASCQDSGFQTRQGQYDLFGMGFASDSDGASTETLFIAGGAYDDRSPGRFGSITNLTVNDLGEIDAPSDFGPELTGTGDGHVYGYFPDGDDPFIQEFDKATGALTGNPYPMTGRGDSNGNMAWAFAHWGGDFYVFLTIGNDGQVYRVDLPSGEETTVIDDLPYRVVGAGVSTCAPTGSPE
ncbi:MAG TPA: hypothetical protein VFG83_14635 [Kofleriaceae bacterium]|nr:hypothetical protein [Kofleriaceae bacterium]